MDEHYLGSHELAKDFNNSGTSEGPNDARELADTRDYLGARELSRKLGKWESLDPSLGHPVRNDATSLWSHVASCSITAVAEPGPNMLLGFSPSGETTLTAFYEVLGVGAYASEASDERVSGGLLLDASLLRVNGLPLFPPEQAWVFAGIGTGQGGTELEIGAIIGPLIELSCSLKLNDTGEAVKQSLETLSEGFSKLWEL